LKLVKEKLKVVLVVVIVDTVVVVVLLVEIRKIDRATKYIK